jgi:hypothetical protein
MTIFFQKDHKSFARSPLSFIYKRIINPSTGFHDHTSPAISETLIHQNTFLNAYTYHITFLYIYLILLFFDWISMSNKQQNNFVKQVITNTLIALTKEVNILKRTSITFLILIPRSLVVLSQLGKKKYFLKD